MVPPVAKYCVNPGAMGRSDMGTVSMAGTKGTNHPSLLLLQADDADDADDAASSHGFDCFLFLLAPELMDDASSTRDRLLLPSTCCHDDGWSWEDSLLVGSTTDDDDDDDDEEDVSSRRCCEEDKEFM